MECKNCGAQLNTTNEECPYCGQPNPKYIGAKKNKKAIPFIDTGKIDTEKVNEKLNNLPIIGLVAIISFFVFAPLSLVISLIGLFSKNKNSKTICKIIFIFDIVVLAFIIGIIILISRYDSNHSSYIGNIYGM